MKHSLISTIILIIIFLIAQIVGLIINEIYFTKTLPYGFTPPKINTQISPFYFILSIIFITAIFILLNKIHMNFLLKHWFFFVTFLCISISLNAFLKSSIALVIAFVITLIKFKERDIYVHNLGEILIYGGIVSLIAPIFNITSIIVLMILISIYDFISVNITKYMIKLVSIQQKDGFFTGIISNFKKDFSILGGGDIAFPLLFATIALREVSMIHALSIIYGSVIGIFTIMIFGKRKKYYPAMPFITAGSILGFIIANLL